MLREFWKDVLDSEGDRVMRRNTFLTMYHDKQVSRGATFWNEASCLISLYENDDEYLEIRTITKKYWWV